MSAQVKNSTFQMNHFYCLSNSVTLIEELDSSGTLATTGPAMIIRSVIRLDTKLQRQLLESFHWCIIYTVPTDKYICMTIEELTAKIRPCERKKNAIHINWKVG